MSKFSRMSFLFGLLLAGVVLLAPVAKAGDQFGYNNGFFVSSADDEFTLKTNGLLQTQYGFGMLDGAGVDNTSAFSVPFARVYLSGHAFGPDWTYWMSFDLASGTVSAVDYYVGWHHCDYMNFKFGQFKVPYGFEFLVPEYHQQFVTASVVTAAGGFVPGREIGFSVSGSGADKKFDYVLAVTNGLANGTGANSGQGAADIDFRYTGRFTMHVQGNHGYWMSDLNKSQEALMDVSVGGYWNKLDVDADGSFENTLGFSADAVYAHNGFSALAEYHWFQSSPTAGDIMNNGINVQGGYFFDDTNELAARFSWLEPDAGGSTMSPGVVWNHFVHGQNAKVSVEYDWMMLKDVPVGLTTDDFNNHSLTAQLQFMI